ncbi:MAG: beta-L-arabinofuranosidase domain-containing protein [Turicibacter sp.]
MKKHQLNYARFGSIKPKGWLFDKMKKDLTQGYVGHLDELLPELLVEDDIYGRDRLTKKVKVKDVGNLKEESQDDCPIEANLDDELLVVDNQAQYLWWNSETQSNWYDGFIRHALLVEDSTYLNKVNEYIKRILSTQDESGYLGIYDEDLRYQFTTENGELWAQSSLFRGLLAYYEATKDVVILEAIKSAVAITMKSYPIYHSQPFYAVDGFAGLTHGLTFTDTLERLYQLTGDESYIEYAVWLFEDYNAHTMSEEDIKISNLMNPNYLFKGHGVHTYEHLRALTIAAYASDLPVYKEALDAYLTKLEKHLTPSGGPIGDEWVGGVTASASVNGYEYCSIHELLDSYSLLLLKSNEMRFADKLEWLYYNAGLGAMHPSEASIAYLKSDNSYAMEGDFHAPQPHSVHQIQTRYKYSPVHQDAAVCCIPNAGRITPYFTRSMYFEYQEGIAVSLFGPSAFHTQINDVEVKITQDTNYPSSFDITFKVEVSQPVVFEFAIRKPEWATSVDIDVDGAEVKEVNDRILISKSWTDLELVSVRFNALVVKREDLIGDVFFSYGPLVYAKEIQGEAIEIKTYSLPGFRDIHVKRTEEIPSYVVKDDMLEASMVESMIKTEWMNAPHLIINLMNLKTLQTESVTLIPMANTVLRQVTFETNINKNKG